MSKNIEKTSEKKPPGVDPGGLVYLPLFPDNVYTAPDSPLDAMFLWSEMGVDRLASEM